MIRWHLAVLAFMSLAVMGCGDDDPDSYPPIEPEHDPHLPVQKNVTHGPCREGHTAFCQHIIGQHAGITSCFDGVRTCVDGAWSACEPLPDRPEADAGVPTQQETP